MRTLFDRLEMWGADPKEAIKRMVDDEAFYTELLVKFLDKRAWEVLETAVMEKKYHEAFLTAHDLKGNAAVLSLIPIKDAVSLVVEDLRYDEPAEDLSAHMTVFLETVSVFEGIMTLFF